MRNALIAGVLISAIAALLSVMWLAQVSALAVQQLGSQASYSIGSLTHKATESLRKADALTDEARTTTNDQRRLMDVSTASVARLIQHTDASLNCDVIGKMGHGKSAIDCRELGLLVRAGSMVSNEDRRLEQFSKALDGTLANLNKAAEHADAILGDESIPRILKALAESSEHFDGTSVHLEAMSAEGQKGMAELAAMMYDLRHPQKTGRFMSALNMALRLLGIAYQSRGALGK